MNRKVLYIVSICLFALVSCGGNEPTPSENHVVNQMPKSAKRGVAFNFSQMTDLPLLSPYISWDYNWGNNTDDNSALWFDTNEIDYCPMCWSGSYSADKIRAYVTAHPKTKYLLAFNEPNLTNQANMTPAQAAALWPPVVALAKELNLKLVSPAMNYGTLDGYSDPIKWLDEFFAQPNVSMDDVYAISVHCYMASVSGLKGFIEMFEKYNKPIWLTEFCAWEPLPSLSAQQDYLCGALNYLETQKSVERYAWFIPRYTNKNNDPHMQLITGSPGELTDLGQMYCYFSPMDTTVWLRANRPIYASEYVKVSNNLMTLRPSNDNLVINQVGHGGLMISNFSQNQQVTYQVYVPTQTSQLTIRYAGYSNSICEVLVDGASQGYVNLPREGNPTDWKDAVTTMPLTAGKHTITLSLFSGSSMLSALILK